MGILETNATGKNTAMKGSKEGRRNTQMENRDGKHGQTNRKIISIAKYAGETVQTGFVYFLNFLALISISLGILNMLPIPVLDGGQFCYCLLEMLNGKPLPPKLTEFGRLLGMIFLFLLMGLALYNDFLRF